MEDKTGNKSSIGWIQVVVAIMLLLLFGSWAITTIKESKANKLCGEMEMKMLDYGSQLGFMKAGITYAMCYGTPKPYAEWCGKVNETGRDFCFVQTITIMP